MIPGFGTIVLNDINKPCRKFHLRCDICSVPQVVGEPSDIEWVGGTGGRQRLRRQRKGDKRWREGRGFPFSLLQSKFILWSIASKIAR